jgi:hypothetical protein
MYHVDQIDRKDVRFQFYGPIRICLLCGAFHEDQGRRHNAGMRLVEKFGWDVARIVLGHRQVSTTRIYALDDVKKAAEGIAKAC